MIINLPLKQTKPIDFFQPFETYINKTYKDPKLYEKIKPVLEKMNNLRASMYFDNVSLATINDIRTQEELEQKIISYIRLLGLLKNRFKFENNDPSSIETTFYWTSSNSPTTAAQSNSINYELAALYYNLAVDEYFSGTLKSLRGEEQDKKFCISRFRNGVWAVNQCQVLVQTLPNPILTQNLDFSKSNLDTLEYLLQGLANKNMYICALANEKQLGLNCTAAILLEATKQFETAQKSWTQFCQESEQNVPQSLLDNTRQVIQYNYVWCLTQACLKMAMFHYAKAKDETRGQNMGKALGYLTKADSILTPILADKNIGDNYPQVIIDSFRTLQNELSTLITDYSNRNAYIYKEQIVNEQMLLYPVLPDNLFIKSLIPPIMNDAHEDENLFSGFVSEVAIQLSKVNNVSVDKKNYEVEEKKENLKVLNDQENQAYVDSYINALIDVAHGQGLQQTQQLISSTQSQGAQILIEEQQQQAGLSQPKEKEFMHSLHLLRGILATWVIFFHTDSTRFPVMDYLPFRSKGYLAVDIFFILSGFMLAHNYRQYFSNTVEKKSWIKFMVMRVARVYPMYFLMGIISVIVQSFQISEIFWLLTRLTFISGIFDQTLLDSNFCNFPSWSVCLEFYMYLIFPFILFWLFQWKKLFLRLCYFSLFSIYVGIVWFQVSTLNGYTFDIEIFGQKYQNSVVLKGILDVSHGIFMWFRLINGYVLGTLVFEKYFSYKQQELEEKKQNYYTYYCTALIFIILLIMRVQKLYFSTQQYQWISLLLDIILILLLAFLVYFLSVENSIYQKIALTRFSQFMGDVSYTIYIVQVIYLSVIYLWSPKESYSMSVQFVFLLVVFYIYLLFCKIVFEKFEVPCKKMIQQYYFQTIS